MSGANDDNEYVPSDEENNRKKKVFSSQVIHIYFLVSIEPRGKQTSSD